MTERLTKPQLLERVTSAIDDSGWRSIIAGASHPFLLRVWKDETSDPLTVRVYIWNCTPGGQNRPEDEFRVQITGVVPEIRPNEITLLLGWHEGFGVFVGFDIQRHAGQSSASPSIQVKEESLLNAHVHGFSAYDRANGEIAVCFRPEMIVEYAMNLDGLHQISARNRDAIAILNRVDETTPEEIAAKIKSNPRRAIIANITRKYREHDFRDRVLTAYRSTCAFCGVQLKLVEAAHVIPVAADTSTDETTNGIALCTLHHRAFDQNLVSFDDRYRIEVSQATLEQLAKLNLIGGQRFFAKGLKSAVVLPADRRDHPSPVYVREARKLRKWKP